MLLFDYCCVPFVVDINVLDTSFHCILQSILSIQVKCKLSLTEDDHTNFHFPASFLSNARSIVNKMDELKLQMAAKGIQQSYTDLYRTVDNGDLAPLIHSRYGYRVYIFYCFCFILFNCTKSWYPNFVVLMQWQIKIFYSNCAPTKHYLLP